MSKYIVSSTKPSSGSATSNNDVSKRLAEIIEREKRCEQTELGLHEKEAALKEKEARLDRLEKEISKRLARVEGMKLASNEYYINCTKFWFFHFFNCDKLLGVVLSQYFLPEGG